MAHKKLNGAIDFYNQQIRLINDIRTPRLSLDIIASHKKSKLSCTKYRKNFNLYTDGIHPSIPLTKLWAYKIIALANSVTDCMKYILRYVLIHTGDTHTCMLKKEGYFIELVSQEKFDLKSIRYFDYVVLFYGKGVESFNNYDVLSLGKFETVGYTHLPICTSFSPQRSVCIKKVYGIKLSKEFYYGILNEQGWLSSDHINVYLNIICKKSSKKVHVVDSLWFSYSLFKNGNPHNLM